MDIVHCKSQNVDKVLKYLEQVDQLFVPTLSSQTNLPDYAKKISEHAELLWVICDDEIIGMCAFYVNCLPKAYLTSISVLPDFQGKGVAGSLLRQTIGICRQYGFVYLYLEVFKHNTRAYTIYQQTGFNTIKDSGEKWVMRYKL